MSKNWRKFRFFDFQPVRRAGATELGQRDLTCCTSGRGNLIFGDATGGLTFVNRAFDAAVSFRAHDQLVSHVHQFKASDFLLTIGDGLDSRPAETREDSRRVAQRNLGARSAPSPPAMAPSATVRVWRLSPNADRDPALVRTIKVFRTAAEERPITAFCVNEEMTALALGLDDGRVLLYSGVDLRSTSRRSTLRPAVLSPGRGDARGTITHLAFSKKEEYAGNASAADLRALSLFVVTTNGVMSYLHVDASAASSPGTELDGRGCGVGCSTLTDDDELIVGQDEAIFFYKTEDRGQCYVFEGRKGQLASFGRHLLISSEDSVAGGRAGHSVTIYDLRSKFIALQFQVPPRLGESGVSRTDKVEFIARQWDRVIIVTASRQVWELIEMDIELKLENLYRKHLYELAISLANSSNYDHGDIARIFCRYGDHLCTKGDYDNAITQYIRTIGHIEPSYVIRRFLDGPAQRIKNLTKYLEELHKSVANADHTTLLLNCYTKLLSSTPSGDAKDALKQKLQRFIRGEIDTDDSSSSGSGGGSSSSSSSGVSSSSGGAAGKGGDGRELKFDVEAAINALRAAGYYEEALFLARKHSKHDGYLRLQLHDRHDFKAALDYIGRFRMNEATGFALAEQFMKAFGKDLVSALPMQTTRFLIALCTADDRGASGELLCSSPEDFIRCFTDQNRHLRYFLGVIVEKKPERATKLVWTTLLELLLRWDPRADAEAAADDDGAAASVSVDASDLPRDEQIMELLKEGWSTSDADYDVNQALVLVQMHNFCEGQLFLYRKLGMYHMLLQHYMEHDDFPNILETCQKFGDDDANLWVQALTYFGARLDFPQLYIEQILAQIEQRNLLPPLVVVQILARNRKMPLSIVKAYITRRLRQEKQQIEMDEREIRKLRDDTEKMRTEIAKLKTSSKAFGTAQAQLAVQSAKDGEAHGMCLHTFHSRTSASGADGADASASASHPAAADVAKKEHQHESFCRELEGAEDGFAKVAEWFGKGVF